MICIKVQMHLLNQKSILNESENEISNSTLNSLILVHV